MDAGNKEVFVRCADAQACGLLAAWRIIMHEIITERPNLFEPDDYITFYIELSGKVRAEELADAVKSAYRATKLQCQKSF